MKVETVSVFFRTLEEIENESCNNYVKTCIVS